MPGGRKNKIAFWTILLEKYLKMAICNKMGKISVFFSRFLNKILAGPLSLFNITYDMSFYSGCFTRGTKCENPRSNLGFSPTFDQKFSYYRLDFSQNLGK